MARKHTTCKVQAEDYSGDLHTATLRIPNRVPINGTTVRRLVQQKLRHKIALITGFTCSTPRAELPHKRKRGR